MEALGKPLSVSHKILPEFREYERTSTVVVNAYLQPLMQSYLEKIGQRARNLHTDAGIAAKSATAAPRIFVMQSNGGITALESAAREPVRTVLSGPAGGLVGAAAMKTDDGHADLFVGAALRPGADGQAEGSGDGGGGAEEGTAWDLFHKLGV